MSDAKKPTDLAEVFAKAAEIAKAVPQNLQEIAFQRALDALMTPTSQGPREEASTTSSAQRPPATDSKNPPQSASSPGKAEDRVGRLINAIDRTEGAQIVSTGRVLDKALLVLRAAHRHGIDALTPGEIAKVLTDKFRERTSAPAVRMALGGDATFTDRRPEGTGFGYRLMAPGERHLEAIESGTGSAPRVRGRAKVARKAKAVTKAKDEVPQTRGGNRTPRAKPPTAGRPGPKAILEALIGQGYFDSPHAIGEVIEYLQSKRGHRYKATDLSPALARLLREEKLDRERDANGQYRYTRKS